MKDGRRAPFCYQTLDAVGRLREHFSGKERTVALAIYQTLTLVANEQRSREGFTASRKEIAELAGVSDRCLDRYSEELTELGLLQVEKRQEGGVHLPNLWTLTEHGGGEAASLPPQGLRQGGGEAASGGVAKRLRPLRAQEAGQEEQQEEEPPNPLFEEWAEDFEGWLSHHWATTGMTAPRAGTKGRQHVWAMYRARREEGLQVGELQLAVEGAYADDFRRERGHYDHESVLRPTKVHKLVEAGRRARAAGKASHHDWAAWVAEHLPELEGAAAGQACMTAQLVRDSGIELTAEAVRERIARRERRLGEAA